MKLIHSIILTTMFISILMMSMSFHPITLGVMVILQSVMISIIMITSFSISWFSFFIFIIYLGGILMLFSYIISLTFSKEPMMKPMNMMIYLLMMMMTMLFFLSKKETMMEMMKLKVSSMYSCFSSSMKMSIFLLTFLLIIMIMVVFITESSKGNMRTI